MERITHAHRACPLWRLNVFEGTQYIPDEGLSVGVVHTDLPAREQISQLDRIKALIQQACSQCNYHASRQGICEPAGFYRGGFVDTVIVNQRSEFPKELKENPQSYYSEF